MKKKVVSMLLAVCLVMGTLAGCGSSNSVTGEETGKAVEDGGQRLICRLLWKKQQQIHLPKKQGKQNTAGF